MAPCTIWALGAPFVTTGRISAFGGAHHLAALATTGHAFGCLDRIGADLFGMALVAGLLLYAFPILVHEDAGVKTSLHKGWLLAALHPWHTLGLLGLGILLAFGVAYVSLGLLFLLPAFYGMFVVRNALLVL